VGYAGGETKHPDYGHMGDHTETVQLDYDPRRISYEALLALFWESHNPREKSWRRQYMNVIFYHDEKQRWAALASKASVEERTGHAVHSQVLPLRSFTLAEAYHQKYLLRRQTELAQSLMRIYPDMNDFINSTAVARLNGYVGGYGNVARLEKELEALGIGTAGPKYPA
jgi:peptide methionine sulfoxide reductase MsrA